MRLYHHTTPEVARQIVKSQRFFKPIDNSMSSYYRSNIWASNKPHGHASGFGSVAVSFDAPDHLVDLDDEFPDGEKHYAVDQRLAQNFKIHEEVSESKHYATLKDPTARAQYVQRHHRRYPDSKKEKEEKKSRNSIIAQSGMNYLVASFNKKMMSRLAQIERIIRNPSKQPNQIVNRKINDIVSVIKSDVLASYHRSYRLGLESCGLGYRFASKRLISSSEQKWVESAVRQEMSYFAGLLMSLKSGKPLSSMAHRVNMYGNSLKSLYSAGQVSGMSPDTVVDWVVDEAAEHCYDCVFLSKNGPYTPDTLPTTPGAGLCRCLSSCKCKLVFRVVGEQVAMKVKLGSRSKDAVLRSIQKAQRTRSRPA